MTDDDLIAQWIEPNPNKPWPAEARLKGYAIPIWAIAADLRVERADLAQIAAEYIAPQEAIAAAAAYYRRHRCEIDGRLLANTL